MKYQAKVLLIAALLMLPLSLLAHHSLSAQFDLDKRTTVTGIITKVEWTNPHAWVYIDQDEAPGGKVYSWAFELPSPNTFERLGWSREAIKSGTIVTVRGYPSRDGARKASVQYLASTDGRKLFADLDGRN